MQEVPGSAPAEGNNSLQKQRLRSTSTSKNSIEPSRKIEVVLNVLNNTSLNSAYYGAILKLVPSV